MKIYFKIKTQKSSNLNFIQYCNSKRALNDIEIILVLITFFDRNCSDGNGILNIELLCFAMANFKVNRL